MDYISVLHKELIRAGILPEDDDLEAHCEFVGMQPGDVPVTYADTVDLERDYDFRPETEIRDSIWKFAE